jgi:DNA processing protein
MPTLNDRKPGEREDLKNWLRLKSVNGLGDLLLKRLYDHFRSPARVLAATDHDLFAIDGMSAKVVSALRHQKLPPGIKRDLDFMQRKGYRILTLSDSRYPALLRQIPDPPPILYVAGNLRPMEHPIAVVGSRNATQYGRATTRRLCTDLARLGFSVISGMALGIDTTAHEGTLMGGGTTVAVLGSGLGNIYPTANRKLFHRIIESGGAVITEFPPATAPDGFNFPRRNRIISGMSLGTVVVEATLRSGSLITANLAADQNREVFAVPGSVNSFKSTGTHTLIKQGAKLVENTQDILEELAPGLPSLMAAQKNRTDAIPAKPPELTEEEQRIFERLGAYPVHIDELVRHLEMNPATLSGLLLQMELKGIVTQLPGKQFTANNAGNVISD